jgi:AcrR family transcriptional regulator
LSTPERILYAAAARIVASGTANLSMQDVADTAGVSKGLIHYHFHDKETLTRPIEWMTHESVEREAATLARSTPKTAVDDL